VTILPLILAGAVLLPVQQEAPHAGALIDLAFTGSREMLVAQVRLYPDATREALQDLLRQSVISQEGRKTPGGQGEEGEGLESAIRLARAYFEVWTDPFLIQEVQRFKEWSLPDRRAKFLADSLRNEGNDVYLAEGVSPAMDLWRSSLHESESLKDLSGMAKSMGNLGAGFYVAGEPDSARAYLTAAYEGATEVGDFRTAASAVTNLANLAFDDGNLREAADLYTQAVVILSRTGEHRHLSAAQHNLALVSMDLGDLRGARDALEGSIRLSRLHGYPEDEAEGLASLADVAQAEGEYQEAAELLDRALILSEDTGSRVAEAGVKHSMGLLNLARGDYRKAEGRLEQSVAAYTELGRLPDAVDVRQDLARARVAAGDLRGGLREVQEAESLAASLALGPLYLADLALTAADLNLAINELPAALGLFRRAHESYAAVNDFVGQAEALEGQGFLFLVREDYQEARDLLERALQLRNAANPVDPRASALTRLYLAAAEEELGEVDAARSTLRRAEESLAAVGDPVGEAAVLATLGGLESRNGAQQAALALYTRGLGVLGGRAAPDVEWRLRAGRGQILQETRNFEEAARELQSALASIVRSADLLPLESRSGFRADKTEVYHRLTEVLLSLGDVDSAFRASEGARTHRNLATLMGARIVPPSEVSGDLVDRQQDLSRRIGDLTLRLRWGGLPRPGLRETPGSVLLSSSDLRAALGRSQSEYLELLREIRRLSPGFSTLVDPVSTSVDEVSSLLTPDQALIEYLVSDEGTVVFVVTADTSVALRLEVGREPLGDMVDFARGVIANGGREGNGQLWRPTLRRLYETLIRPVEDTGLLRDRPSLIIVPHGELHYLPFQALLRSPDDSFLAERYAVSYAPSAGAWVRLVGPSPEEGSAEQAAPVTLPGTRVLAMAPRVEELPGSRYEVEVIGRLFQGEATVLIGEDASKAAFWDAAPLYDIIHLATFGVLNKANPLFSFVEMGETGGDPGFLEAHEIYGLGLKARLLTLSACETAMGSGGLWDVPPGDDWISLSAAFLGAGVETVLASLWKVEDLATAELMQRFYRHLVAGAGMEEALALAQRELILNPDTAHPFFWAGFQLLGRGGAL